MRALPLVVQLHDVLQCKVCGHNRTRTDPYLDIELGVGGGVTSVSESLARFVAPELLTGDNRWECDTCGVKVDAEKALRIASLPPVLTLHLKR